MSAGDPRVPVLEVQTNTHGEPLFVLRAQDRFAPEIIEEWAERVERSVVGTVSGAADKTRQKVKHARALAHTMRAWQTLNRSKTPD